MSRYSRTFIIIIVIGLPNWAALYGQCTHPDYDALIKLYDATNGDLWLQNSGWKQGKEGTACNPCDFNGDPWFGLNCHQNRVTEVTLDVNNLDGFIPDLQLDELLWFSLLGNPLRDTIPNFLGIPKVRYMSFSECTLSGSIPNFSNCPDLIEFWAYDNVLSGSLPNFQDCQNLGFIELGINELTGPMPNLALPALDFISLFGNFIEGEFPTFENSPQLRFVDICGNLFSGSFPDFSVHPFTENLTIFAFDNQFSGCFPESICDLSFVDLALNNEMPMHGDHIPFCNGEDQIGASCGEQFGIEIGTIQEDCSCVIEICDDPHPDLDMLMTLYDALNGENWTENNGWQYASQGYLCDPCSFVGYGPWTGITCDNFDRVICIDLDGLDNCGFNGFTGNGLTGELPVLKFDKLETLILDGNTIYGNLPDMSGMPSLKRFWARLTGLSGPLPDFTVLPNLEELRISYNALNGEIPDISQMPNLKIFTGLHNEFSGCFPDGICELEIMETKGNIDMPWEGEVENFCNGESQIGAPCSDGNAMSNNAINENCECVLLSSIDDFNLIDINIFPNPVLDKIKFSNCNDCKQIEIYSMTGISVLKTNIQDNSVNVEKLNKGTYFLKITDNGDVSFVKKIVKL